MLKMSGEGFFFSPDITVQRGIHGSAVKMSGEAQNHLTYSEHATYFGRYRYDSQKNFLASQVALIEDQQVSALY